ncbi:arginine N-methyltransferase [Raphidocelis subcapitata]|uniref:Arginine N-methyltransferase n=1 Tax=Raphidocelis subcapitata TaxID=307507 RepID=A0A2V0NL15_9CHLO|nr:arginine N-methyltransferase [Raphidocelis subcapitata]|eukprot:GBF88061.1 arginine N-methyltransferase [Raphidocelis subcapitata]
MSSAAAAAAGPSADTADAAADAALAAAAAAGDGPALAAALAAGGDACAPGPGGAAAEAGSLECVRMLLEEGAPWNALDDEGYCAGDYATASKERSVIELLMDWGVSCEQLLGAAGRAAAGGGASPSGSGGASASRPPGGAPAPNADYLSQRLVYDGDRLLDADGEAVMMGWELPLMVEHAKEICARGGDILNVGFGLGLVDEEIQKHSPRSHTIVEAHPDVHARMLELGWHTRPGVTILFGRWQDVLPQLLARSFDGVFFDTYGEYYEELHEFHSHLPKLMARGGIYSFFNGFASDNAFFHLVYGRLIQLELQRLGFSTEFRRLQVDTLGDDHWRDVRTRYWRWPWYFLPVCRLGGGGGGAAAAAEGEEGGAAVA